MVGDEITVRFSGGTRDGTSVQAPWNRHGNRQYDNPMTLDEADGPWWDDPARCRALTGELYSFSRNPYDYGILHATFVGYPI